MGDAEWRNSLLELTNWAEFFAPPGWHAQILGAPIHEGHLQVDNGCVLAVEFVPDTSPEVSPADAPEGSESEDSESSQGSDAFDSGSESAPGTLPNALPAGPPPPESTHARERSRSPRRRGSSPGHFLWSAGGRVSACAKAGAPCAVLLGNMRPWFPLVLLIRATADTQPNGCPTLLGADDATCVDIVPPSGFVADILTSGRHSAVRLLQEPTRVDGPSQDALDNLHTITVQLGFDWIRTPFRWVGDLPLTDDVPLEETEEIQSELAQVQFLILKPLYMPETSSVLLEIPATLGEFEDAVQQVRDEHCRTRFPHLCNVVPQSLPGCALFVALPTWGPTHNIVCFNTLAIDGRLFSAPAPVYADMQTLAILAQIPEAFDYVVYVGLEERPLATGVQAHLFPGVQLTFTFADQPAPEPAFLPELLLSPAFWVNARLPRSPLLRHAYCLATATRHVLHVDDFSQPFRFRQHIASCLGLPADSFRTFPARPVITDIELDGIACNNVIAVSCNSLSLSAQGVTIILDCRPILEGMCSLQVPDGLLDVQALRRAFISEAPPGQAVLVGDRHDMRSAAVIPGQVLTVAYEASEITPMLVPLNPGADAAGAAVPVQETPDTGGTGVNANSGSDPTSGDDGDAPPEDAVETSDQEALDARAEGVRFVAVILCPDYKPEVCCLQVPFPAPLLSTLAAISAVRDELRWFRFPSLIPVFPQPDWDRAYFAARPVQPTPTVFVVFDTRPVDGRLFALDVPRRLSRTDIITIARLNGQPFLQIFVRDVPWALDDGTSADLSDGDLVSISPPASALTYLVSLEDRLQDPAGWDVDVAFLEDPPQPTFTVLGDADSVRIPAVPHRRPFLRHDIVLALRLGSEPLDICPASPGIFDYAARGCNACAVLVATQALQDWPEPDPADCVYFIDQRPMLLGLIWGIARGGLVDIAAIRSRLRIHCPPGYELTVRGGSRSSRHHEGLRLVRSGEILTAELYLTGFLPPDVLFPDPAPGPSPSEQDGGGGPSPSGYRRESSQAGTASRDDARDPTAPVGAGQSAGRHQGRNFPYAISVIGLLCLGLSCTSGIGFLGPAGLVPFRPSDLLRSFQHALCHLVAVRVTAPMLFALAGHRRSLLLGFLAIAAAMPLGAPMPLRPMPISAAAKPPTCGNPCTGRPLFPRDSHALRFGEIGVPRAARATPFTSVSSRRLQTVSFECGPTLLEEAAMQPGCAAFWKAATLLETLHHVPCRSVAVPETITAQPQLLNLSSLVPNVYMPCPAAPMLAGGARVHSGTDTVGPLRLGGLLLPFALKDLLDLIQPPARLVPLSELISCIPCRDRQRLSALNPRAADLQGSGIHCFTDGSYTASTATHGPLVGWACVFVDPTNLKTFLCSGGWPHWLSCSDERPSAFVAECVALTAASLIGGTIFQGTPLSFCVDCTAALSIAAGDISGHGKGIAGVLRRISYLFRAVTKYPPRYHHVAGHKGCFANEVADVFAKLAARGCAFGDWSWGTPHSFPWWANSGIALDWAGLAIRSHLGDPSLPPLHDPALAVPTGDGGLSPLQCIEPFLRKRESAEAGPLVTGRMRLTLLTYNVLSLCGKSFSDAPSDGIAFVPARPAILAECLQSAGVCVAALQEARTSEGTLCTDPYLRFCSGALKGQFGVELWFKTGCNIVVCDSDSKRTINFERADFLVLHTDPRRIFVLFSKAGTAFLFVSAHAPHKGSESHLIDSWWAETRRLLDTFGRRAPLIFMGDFNAAIGSVCSPAIGSLHQDSQDFAGEYLHDLAILHSLWVASTFDGVHSGPGGTYVQKRNGQESRLDFICLPGSWSKSQVSSWVDPSIHAGQPIIDHIAALVSLDLLLPFSQPARKCTVPPIDPQALLTPKGRATLQQILCNAPRVDWAVGPDAHAAILIDYLQKSLRESFPRPKVTRRHSYLSDATWELHLQVKSLRRRSSQLRAAIAYHTKAACFQAWQASQHACTAPHGHSGWMLQARHASEHIAQELQTAAKSLRAGCKADRAKYLAGLADQVQKGDKEAPHALKRLLCVRKRKPFAPAVLPQLKNPSGDLCTSPEEVMASWRDHFSRIEGGRILSHEEIAIIPPAPISVFEHVPFEDFPSPSDLLEALLSARKGRAAGPDGIPAELGHAAPTQMQQLLTPLLLKVGLFCREPIGFKSGILTWLFKGKGSRTECNSYRAIMLLSNVAKTLHRAFRPAIYRFFSDTSLPVQIGGKKQTTVLFGSHISRAYGRWCAQTSMSTIILFADVAAAYYSAVRALTARSHANPDEVTEAPAAVQPQLAKPSALAAGGATPWLEQLTSDFNNRTWMTLAGDTEAILTTKGSRPGSSWADLFFGVTMPGIVALRDSMREQCAHSCRPISVWWDGERSFFDSPRSPAKCVEARLDDVVWADDLASFLQIDRPADIARTLGFEASTLVEAFAGFGYSLSFGEHKTAAIVAVRGHGARSARRALFSGAAKVTVLCEDKGADCLPLVSSYKHLGVKVTADNSLLPEIRFRIASAWTAFRQGRTKLFRSKRLGLVAKGHLLSSHVVSRLAFGCGAWGLLRLGEFRAFAGALLSMYRQCLCVSHNDPQDLSCATICALIQQPDPLTLLRLHRLRYARQLIASGPEILWALLKADGAFVESMQDAFRWAHRWLANTTGLSCPSTHWAQWASMIETRPTYFKGLVKRAGALEGIRVSCYAALQALRKTLCLIVGCRDPCELANPTRPAHYTEACLLCKIAFPTRATWAVHAARKHGYRAPATLYAGESDKPLCSGCGKLYANKGRLRRHLLNSVSCRVAWGAFQVDEAVPEGIHTQRPPMQLSGRCLMVPPRVDPSTVHQGLVDALLGLDNPDADSVWATVLDFVEPIDVLRQSLRFWASHQDAPTHAAALADDAVLLLDPELWCEDFRGSKAGVSTPVACADLEAPCLCRFVCAADGPVARFVLPPPPVPEFVYPFWHSLPLRAAREQCAWLEHACDTVGAFLHTSAQSQALLVASDAALTCLEPVSSWILECGFARSTDGAGPPH